MPEPASAGGDRPPYIVDLWRMANAGTEAREQILVLGVTEAGPARALLGLDREDTASFDRGDGHLVATLGSTFCQFDPDGRLSGLGYGDYYAGCRIDAAVEMAVAGLDGSGDPVGDMDLRIGPEVRLHYNGFRVRQFATLPRFISVSKEIQGFELSSWPQDKSVTLSRQTESATLYATFALKVFKTEYTEHFQVDYCLSWLAVFTAASIASGLEPTGAAAS